MWLFTLVLSNIDISLDVTHTQLDLYNTSIIYWVLMKVPRAQTHRAPRQVLLSMYIYLVMDRSW
jgi:hypothetical protein